MNKKNFAVLLLFIIVSTVSLIGIVKTTAPKKNKILALENKIRADEALNITKTKDFFSLSYNGVPQINIEKYELIIDGLVKTPLFLNYNDLRKLQYKEEAETLTCIALVSAKGIWRGIPLRDILKKAKAKKEGTYVIFYAADGYSSAIPLENAIKSNVILATELNGEMLTPEHGFPLRLVYPGYYGYKWVKWINHIKVVNFEYKGHWESAGYSNEANIKP